MTGKRKKSKNSPENAQTEARRPTKSKKGGKPENKTETTQVNMNNPQAKPQHSQPNVPDNYQAGQNFMCNPPNMPMTYNIPNQYMTMATASPVFQNGTRSGNISPDNINNSQAYDHGCSTGSQSQGDMLALLLRRLDSMDTKLRHLEAIQSNISTLTIQVKTTDAKINSIEEKLGEIEKSREFDSNMLDKVNKKQSEMEKIIKKMERNEEKHREEERVMKVEITDLKCRSMRENLMFYNLTEERDEDCKQKLISFIEREVKIEDAQAIVLQRAHRVGPHRHGKTRPIVAKFAYDVDKERVRRAARNLKGTPYGISEQFPREVNEKRKRLIPIMKQAKHDGKEAVLRVDKLFINNVLYKEE